MPDPNIVYIELSTDNRPFTVVTESNGLFDRYDFEYSRKLNSLIYEDIGSGCDTECPTGPYWAAPGIVVNENYGGRRIKRLPNGFQRQTLFENAIEGETIWCSRCKDQILEEDPCDHIWWCDTCGTWSVPGDRCGHTRNQCDNF
jgi:hypothetical protein